MELERFKHQHKIVECFKPMIDDRYSDSEIVSHSGWSAKAHCVKEGSDILGVLANNDDEVNVVAVDEAFMIPGISDVLTWLHRNGMNIIVSTLDMSSNGKSFREVEKMMAYATHVEKCTAVCTVCGADARYTYKKQVGGDEIEVGGKELYEPRCFLHFPMLSLMKPDA
jgi:thymidine kinase